MGAKVRLLEAAGEAFAQHGFRDATVREISKNAGLNVAAVNYYFGDKQSLYFAVLVYSLSSAIEKYPPDYGLGENPTTEDRFRAFIRSFLFRVFDEGRPAWHGKLMIREVIQPTAAFDQMVHEAIKPLHLRLSAIVRALLGEKVTERVVMYSTFSVIGQCVSFIVSRRVFAQLYSLKFDRMEIERLVDHITNFSLCALKGLSEGAGMHS